MKPKKIRKSKKLKLNGHTVQLHYVDLSCEAINKAIESTDSDEELFSGMIFGYYTPNENAIYIDPNHPTERVQDTLIHEALHVIDEEYHFNLSHSKIHVIASALQQLLAPWLKKV